MSTTPPTASHDHVFLGAGHDRNARRTHWVIALTVIMMVGEILAGHVTGSMALLADGFHMATHAGALSIAAFAYTYAKRHARSPDFTFGTGKVGDLAGFASATILGLIALGIGVESAMRFFQPIRVAFLEATTVAAIGLAVNVVSALLLSGGHDHHHHGHHHHSHDHAHAGDNNLRSAYMHVLADALTSVLAIVALLAGYFAGWRWMDPAMGLVGAVVIARWSWSLMRDTAAVLLDKADRHIVDEVRDLIEAPGDAKILDLHVWRIGPDAWAAIVSAATDVRISGNQLRARLAPVHELVHLTIERYDHASADAPSAGL